MTCVVGLVYLGTLVGVILPRLHELVAVDEVDINPYDYMIFIKVQCSTKFIRFHDYWFGDRKGNDGSRLPT